MTEKVNEIIVEYETLLKQVNSPEIYNFPEKLKVTTSRLSELEELYSLAKKYKELSLESEEATNMNPKDTEEKEFIDNIINQNSSLLINLEKLIKKGLSTDSVTPSPSIIEIRAGTGGEEASIFAGDLFGMYTKYASNKGWQWEIINANEGVKGGFKEVTFVINDTASYPLLYLESGVHRVQRVPETESAGRIHTSAASVVVYPLVESETTEIDPSEIEIITYRSSGPGGQSVNTTDSAVRIRHIPTDITVTCQDNKSQHKNKDQAMRLLKSKLADIDAQNNQSQVDSVRKSAIKSGDRSVKIRTYNYPQSRITDHRINKSWYNLEDKLNGNLDLFLKELNSAFSDDNES